MRISRKRKNEIRISNLEAEVQAIKDKEELKKRMDEIGNKVAEMFGRSNISVRFERGVGKLVRS